MSDVDAINECDLPLLIESMPYPFAVIGDNAYTSTERFISIFGGNEARISANDNFNFFASQQCIRIEMAFGLMTRKWGILQRPLQVPLKKVGKVIIAIGKLHNFCIDERICETGAEAYEMELQAQIKENRCLVDAHASAPFIPMAHLPNYLARQQEMVGLV